MVSVMVVVVVEEERRCMASSRRRCSSASASAQGLTLVHFSAQLKRILWGRGTFGVYVGGV